MKPGDTYYVLEEISTIEKFCRRADFVSFVKKMGPL